MKDGPAAITDRIMDLLLDMVCVVDADGRYVYLNGACRTLLGYEPDELIGRRMIDLVHPDDRGRTLEAARKVMGGKPHIDFENRYLRKDGRVVDVMWSARWSESDGMRLAVARDVTELKRAARRNEAMYRISEAAQSAPDLTALLRHVHELVDGLLPMQRFYVAMAGPDNGRLWFPYFFDGAEVQQEPIPLEAGTLLARVIRERKAVVANAGRTPSEVTAPASGSSGNDWIGAPLATQSDLAGAIVMQQGAEGFGYAREDLELLKFVADQVASAIERKRQEERLFHMAHHDPLTGLPNRALFQDRLKMALRRAHREKELLALFFLDLRDFKTVNDDMGHAAGDEVLREVARRLKSELRESDTASRLGGDEFTVIANNIRHSADVGVISRKLVAAVARPLEVNGETLSLAVDIGAAVYPQDGDEPERLLARADEAMYLAKHNERAPGRGGSKHEKPA